MHFGRGLCYIVVVATLAVEFASGQIVPFSSTLASANYMFIDVVGSNNQKVVNLKGANTPSISYGVGLQNADDNAVLTLSFPTEGSPVTVSSGMSFRVGKLAHKNTPIAAPLFRGLTTSFSTTLQISAVFGFSPLTPVILDLQLKVDETINGGANDADTLTFTVKSVKPTLVKTSMGLMEISVEGIDSPGKVVSSPEGGTKEVFLMAKVTKKADPGAYGDPHFNTWTGEMFDFHGACDLVYVHNPGFHQGVGMDIHVRTKMRRQWSYIDTLTLRIGTDVLEVKGGAAETYWLNNVEQDATPTNTLSGFSLSYHRSNSKQRTFIVDLGQDQRIEIGTFKDFVSVTIHGATAEDFGTSTGLAGEFGTGRKLTRDGLSEMVDDIDYGQEWQVHPSLSADSDPDADPMLFRKVEGPQFPEEQCILPTSVVLTERRRRLSESEVKQGVAEKACKLHHIQGSAEFDACVFDVLLTDDIEMVLAY
jgi:hypothetical protein